MDYSPAEPVPRPFADRFFRSVTTQLSALDHIHPRDETKGSER
jgi:hypothetical protein